MDNADRSGDVMSGAAFMKWLEEGVDGGPQDDNYVAYARDMEHWVVKPWVPGWLAKLYFMLPEWTLYWLRAWLRDLLLYHKATYKNAYPTSYCPVGEAHEGDDISISEVEVNFEPVTE